MSTMDYIDIQCPTAAEMFGLMPKGSSRPLRFEIFGYAELEDGQRFPILGKSFRLIKRFLSSWEKRINSQKGF
ncbi:hypothetical protein QMP26_21105 [Enterocloster clostridioformis]|uniref:hypothetical protein n=1 Tax=Enterocloster clostridioformis TaxID=1531 RepID=UPI002675AB05|nr:hypothetical protein [Enterocloster clostridioformis]